MEEKTQERMFLVHVSDNFFFFFLRKKQFFGKSKPLLDES